MTFLSQISDPPQRTEPSLLVQSESARTERVLRARSRLKTPIKGPVSEETSFSFLLRWDINS